jgi:S-formylglutathione hydrolase FrmB
MLLWKLEEGGYQNMALFNIKFLATSIMMQMHFLVFLPESIVQTSAQTNRKLRVLWLLPPEGGDCSDWIRLSLVEEYAQKNDLALVMPNMDNSMYMDMIHGGYPYFTYLTKDLPNHVRNLFSVLSIEQKDNFVAGVLMGGYGAVKWMLREPNMFGGSACLSGDIDIVGALREQGDALTRDWEVAFGGTSFLENTLDDTFTLCKESAEEKKKLSPIFVACSREEKAFERRKRTVQSLQGLGVDISFYEGGGSEWPFWNTQIEQYIRNIAKEEQRHVQG